jgi:hypothetical protein
MQSEKEFLSSLELGEKLTFHTFKSNMLANGLGNRNVLITAVIGAILCVWRSLYKGDKGRYFNEDM